MNCDEAKALLSPFYDDQLSTEDSLRLTAHIERCASCAETIADYKDLSNFSGQLRAPEPPAGLWERIDNQLHQTDAPTPTEISSPHRRLSTRRIVTGMALALLIGFTLFLLPHAFHNHDALAVDFDHYLEAYAEDPDRAAEVLFAEYPAEEVDIETATKRVGYRPVVGNALPEGYAIESMHVMKMPCCTCIKTVCRTDQGSPFVVFEHDAEQPLWFGDRQKRNCDCGGMPTSVVDFDHQIAATWQVGKRSVTVIGARDVEEITKLMPHLGKNPSVL